MSSDNLDLLKRYDCCGYLLMSFVIYERTPSRRTYAAIRAALRKHLFQNLLPSVHVTAVKDEEHELKIRHDFLKSDIDSAVDFFFLYVGKKEFLEGYDFASLPGPKDLLQEFLS